MDKSTTSPDEDREAGHRSSATTATEPPLSLLESLSPLVVWILAFGYILIAASIAFLLFLWSGTGTGTGTIWRQIALAGWISRCVSLASSVIRLSIALQASAATSMCAALLLHGFNVRLPDVAAISMMRWQNAGPQALIWKIFLHWKTRHGRLVHWIVLALALTTTVSQFASTLLLSDIRQKSIVSNPATTSVLSALDADSTVAQNLLSVAEAGSYWSSIPDVFPTLAEYHDPVEQQEEGIYDTGPTFRAFFPIANQSLRPALQQYSGSATVLDARTICVKPKLLSLFPSVNNRWQESWYYKSEITLAGTLVPPDVNNSYFTQAGMLPKIWFSCTAPFNQHAFPDILSRSQSPEWQLIVCGTELSGILGSTPESIAYPDGIYPDHMLYTNPFLVLNTSGDFTAWYDFSLRGNWTEEELTTISQQQGPSEWSVYSPPLIPSMGNLNPARLGLSLCYAPMSGVNLNISAWGGQVHTEASLGMNLTTGRYNTSSIQASLVDYTTTSSLSSIPPTDRGHLHMSATTWQTLVNTTPAENAVVFTNLLKSLNNQPEASLNGEFVSNYFCSSCVVSGGTQVSAAFAAIFNDIVRATNHPALALQAVFTVASGMSYYNLLPLFTVEQEMTTSTYVTIIAPTQWTGLLLVLGLVVVHCVLTMAVLGLFVRARPRRSVIGSAWSALAQLVESPTTRECLYRERVWEPDEVIEDDAVEDRLKELGRDAWLVGVGVEDSSSKGGGQVVIKPRKDD